jgi:AraC family transcriptional regulator of adaptative response/methylated-DNA-[protein]-cysteine methyltransferase
MKPIPEKPIPANDPRWQLLSARDSRAEGAFFYGVVTTGIFCRPTCASRLPRRENVLFFDTVAEAQAAGFRPCKRCNPTGNDDADTRRNAVIQACKLMDEAEKQPTLEDLSNAVGLSPFYFQRVFKSIVGITPKQYSQQKRAERLRGSLQGSESITRSIYDAGFGSSSRFYTQAVETLGMKPSDYKKGGSGLNLSYAVQPFALGWVLVAATGQGICAIDLGDSPEEVEKHLCERFPNAVFTPGDATFSQWVAEVLAYLDSPNHDLNLPLDIQGTAFQRRVWMALRSIPCGSTASYSEVAEKIGSPKSVRAVAHACASNTLAVAIPCHRVVRSNGALGGYRWGLERKRKLLDREHEVVSGG